MRQTNLRLIIKSYSRSSNRLCATCSGLMLGVNSPETSSRSDAESRRRNLITAQVTGWFAFRGLRWVLMQSVLTSGSEC